MEGGDCSKGKVWVRQTGLACCFLFLQLALVVATFFYFYNIFILHSMQRHHRDGNINLLTKVTSLPHTAILGIWRWKRLGVYLWSKMFPHKWQCLYRARASVCVWRSKKWPSGRRKGIRDKLKLEPLLEKWILFTVRRYNRLSFFSQFYVLRLFCFLLCFSSQSFNKVFGLTKSTFSCKHLICVNNL